MARSLVLFLDGTGCSAIGGLGKHFSNVFRTSLLLDNAVGRLTYLYFPGPASRNSSGKLWNSITGSEVNDILLEAYLSICSNMPDQRADRDRIYIFGYSRGAAVAKALVSMINAVGLLHRRKMHLLKHAWRRYAEKSASSAVYLAGNTRPAKISFVGLFDPVPGPDNPSIHILIDDLLPDAVAHAVEVISMDERRRAFKPKLWSEEQFDPFSKSIAKPFDDVARGRLQQILMPGGHGDIGHPEGSKLISDISFLTMAERIQAKTNLRLNKEYLQKIYSDVISELRTIVVERPLGIWMRKRRLEINSWTEIHMLAELIHDQSILFKETVYGFNGKTLFTNHKKCQYSFDVINKDHAKIYELSLRNVSVESGTSAAQTIREAVIARLSQI